MMDKPEIKQTISVNEENQTKFPHAIKCLINFKAEIDHTILEYSRTDYDSDDMRKLSSISAELTQAILLLQKGG